jgi:hypothetical protein
MGNMSMSRPAEMPPAVDACEPIPIDESVRNALGLNRSETLHLLDRGTHTLLLERRDAPGREVASGGVPSLRAEIERFSLADVFAWLESAGRSGLLRFGHRDHEKAVYLHRGEVVFASSNQMVDRLGECLLRAGVISLEQLRDAERCFEPPARFGKVLVERGFLTPRELWNGVKYQVEEIVRSLFAYSAGTVHFFDGDVQPDNVVRLALPTRRLVEEGVQRAEELRKFLTVLDSPRVRLAVVRDSHIPLARSERRLVDAIVTDPCFASLCETLGLERESAARSIQLLRLVGAIKLVRSEDDPAFLGAGDLEAGAVERVRESVERYAKLIGVLAAPLAAAEGEAPVAERLGRTLEEAAGRYPELLAGVSIDPGPSLPVEPVVRRALRLASEREEQVAAALLELVSYLEFELKNHPEVEDADAILAAAAPLRAGLTL